MLLQYKTISSEGRKKGTAEVGNYRLLPTNQTTNQQMVF